MEGQNRTGHLQPMNPPEHAYTIAIVEDEPVTRQKMLFQLEHKGFSVQGFENATQLYRFLSIQPRTIVVLDIGLPGEDRMSICNYLREHGQSIGIVFVTARGQRDDRLAGLATGADAYLTKPVDMDELVLILKRLARRFSAKEQISSHPETT